MRELRVYWRPRHVTPDKIDALRAVLAEHPGEDEVIVVLRTDRLRLGVRVDSTSTQLVRAASLAVNPDCVIAIDTTDAF